MVNEYYSILENCEHELTEKKSRFIANLIHVETESEAKEKILEISKKHFNSKHNVFAYRILTDGNIIDKYRVVLYENHILSNHIGVNFLKDIGI